MLGLALLCLVRARAAEPDTATSAPEPAPAEAPSAPAPATEPPPAPAPTPPAESGPPTDAPPAPAPAGGPAPVDGSFDSVLREAKQRYFQGDTEGARELLAGLQARVAAGEPADWDLVVDALTYYGEIEYERGNRDAASATFRILLERDLETPISPYHHPIEVVSWFEFVRSTVRNERDVQEIVPPPVPVEPPPAPAWTFAPFGVPQFAQRRPVAGAVYGGLQVAFGVSSLALYGHLVFSNDDPAQSGLDWNREQVIRNVQRRRYFVQWPLTVAFYTTWGISAIDAARWHQKHPPRLSVGLGPGAGLTVGGTF